MVFFSQSDLPPTGAQACGEPKCRGDGSPAHHRRRGRTIPPHWRKQSAILGQAPAKKAVETWGQSVAFGHFHTSQSFTKASPAQESQRFTGTCLPCMCGINPGYGRGRANRWVVGFGLVAVRPNGDTNLFPVIISDGQFTMPDGQVYGKRHKRAA